MHTKKHYNAIYADPNCFQYSERIYGAYINALISKFRLEKGSTVLDAPCGQGFFSYLFSKNGMKVCASDISEVGIAHAQQAYPACNIDFRSADIRKLPFRRKFDCVFTRSCSLYNAEDFASNNELTHLLLDLLKPNGLFIFAYNTNLKGVSNDPNGWINHQLSDVRQHFRDFERHKPKFYLINKIDTLLLREYAFNQLFSEINNGLIRALRRSGDLLCVFRKAA